jgi:hypothetical protein
MWGLIAALVVFGACIGSASAQDYPDLRGSWVGDAKAVLVNTAQYYMEGEAAVVFNSSAVVLKIDQQQGRRFAGTVEVDKWTKPFVGVFTTEGMIQWAEPGGIVEAQVLDADTLDYCYLHSAEFMQLAACANLKRQK